MPDTIDVRYLISIHALVKRATRVSRHTTNIKFNFNPRPREEGDFSTYLSISILGDFNPRPREEGDSIFHRGTNHF